MKWGVPKTKWTYIFTLPYSSVKIPREDLFSFMCSYFVLRVSALLLMWLKFIQIGVTMFSEKQDMAAKCSF